MTKKIESENLGNNLVQKSNRVNIKRVKKNNKKITLKEEILAAAGIGGALMGTALMGGSASASPQTRYVRTLSNTGSAKAKAALAGIFKVDAAKADTPTVTMSTTSLADAVVGQSYSTILQATGGTGPYTFSIVSGSLPLGMSLDQSGIITGMPVTPSSAPIPLTFQITDSAGDTAIQNLTLKVDPPVLTDIVTTFLPDAAVGSPYTQQLQTSGFSQNATLSWSISPTDTLPSGLFIDPTTGIISGTPTTAGQDQFSVLVTDGVNTAGQVLTINVDPSGASNVSIATTSVPDANVGTTYIQPLQASGFDPKATLSWSVTSGSLPDGLTLDPALGVISGTPTASAAAMFTVTVTDGTNIASELMSMNVFPALQDQSSADQSATFGDSSQAPQGLQMPAGYLDASAQAAPVASDFSQPATQTDQTLNSAYVAAPAVQTASAVTGQTTYYTVQKGDTLWALAQQYYGDGSKWTVIMQANAGKVSSPESLRIGTVLVIPALS